MISAMEQFLERYVGDRYARACLTHVTSDFEGHTHLIGGTYVYELANCPAQPSIESSIEGLTLRRQSIEAEELTRALRAYNGLALLIGKSSISTMKWPFQPFSWSVFADASRNKADQGWPAHVIRGSGDAPERWVPGNNISDAAQCWPNAVPSPLGGWPDVQRLLGRSRVIGGHHGVLLEIVAPTHARLLDGEVGQHGRELTIQLESLADPREEQLGLLVTGECLSELGLSLKPEDWDDAGAHRYQGRIGLPAGTGWLKVRLTSSLGVLDVQVVAQPGLSGIVNAYLDPESKWMLGLLEPRVPKAQKDMFLLGVTALLGACRIPVIPLGVNSKGGQNCQVDLSAFLPGDRVLIGECTTAPPTRDDLDKLQARVVELRTVLAQSFPGVCVLGAVFIPARAESIPMDIFEDAAGRELCIVCKERLLDLHSAALAGEAPSLIWTHFKSWARRALVH